MKAKQFFTHAAAFHAKMAKAHSAMASECEEDSPADVFNKSAAEAHTDMGEHAVACCKALGDGDDLDKLQPTRVSFIAPTPAPELKAIPRFGQREISAGIDTTPNHPSIFSKIYANESEE